MTDMPFWEYEMMINGRKGYVMGEYKPTIILDFDGVIHEYSSGWRGRTYIPDPPVEGAMEFIRNATSFGYRIAIVSSRGSDEAGRLAIYEWLKYHLRSHMKEFHGNAYDEQWFEKLMLEDVTIPKEKPPAVLTIDDRAYQFKGPDSWPCMDWIRDFKPWNKGGDCGALPDEEQFPLSQLIEIANQERGGIIHGDTHALDNFLGRLGIVFSMATMTYEKR